MIDLKSTSLKGVLAKLSSMFKDKGDEAKAQRSALFAFAIRVASAGIAFLSQILLARWMGVFEYGVFIYIWIIISVLSILATIGFDASAVRFVAQYRENGENGLLRGFMRSSVVITIVGSSIFAVVGAGLVFALEGRFDNIYYIPFLLAFICLPMFAITELQEGFARAYSWIDVALIPPYIIRPSLLLLFLALAAFLGAAPSAKYAMMAAIGATWLTAIGQIIVFRKRLKRKTKRRVKPKYSHKQWISVSLSVLLMAAFYMLTTYADIIIMNIFLTPKDVGIYFATLKTTKLVEFVYFSVVAAATHKFSEYHTAGRHEDLKHFLKNTINWIFWPSLGMGVVILVLGWPLLWLFGPEFTIGYPVMFILMIGFVIKASTGPAESLLCMLGHQNVCALALLAAVGVNIGLNFLLIPTYGLMGASSATTISLIMVSLTLSILAKRRLGMHLFVFGGVKKDISPPAGEKIPG